MKDELTVVPLTEKTARALQVIRENKITHAEQFGRLFWGGDHPSWRKVGKCGHGSSRGVGMRLGAGGFLGRLRARNLIRGYGAGTGKFYLTNLGYASLEAFEVLQRAKEQEVAGDVDRG